MSIKRFRLVCSIASILLKVIAGMTVIGVAIVAIFSLFGILDPSFSIDFSDAQIFSMGGVPTEAEEELTANILGPFFSVAIGIICWKGSQLFDQLYIGETPFRLSFAQSVRRIGLSIIAFDLLSPIIYSIVQSLVMSNGNVFFLRMTSMFLIGLILYVVSEMLYYGIHLQEFSDDTV